MTASSQPGPPVMGMTSRRDRAEVGSAPAWIDVDPSLVVWDSNPRLPARHAPGAILGRLSRHTQPP